MARLLAERGCCLEHQGVSLADCLVVHLADSLVMHLADERYD